MLTFSVGAGKVPGLEELFAEFAAFMRRDFGRCMSFGSGLSLRAVMFDNILLQ